MKQNQLKQFEAKETEVLESMDLEALYQAVNRLNKLLDSQPWDKATESGFEKAKAKFIRQIEQRTKLLN